MVEGLADVPPPALSHHGEVRFPSALHKIIDNDNFKYKACKESDSKLTSHLFNSTKIVNKKIDKLTQDVACQFIDCVIKFHDVHFLAPSIDVFIHNNKEQLFAIPHKTAFRFLLS